MDWITILAAFSFAITEERKVITLFSILRIDFQHPEKAAGYKQNVLLVINQLHLWHHLGNRSNSK